LKERSDSVREWLKGRSDSVREWLKERSDSVRRLKLNRQSGGEPAKRVIFSFNHWLTELARVRQKLDLTPTLPSLEIHQSRF